MGVMYPEQMYNCASVMSSSRVAEKSGKKLEMSEA